MIQSSRTNVEASSAFVPKSSASQSTTYIHNYTRFKVLGSTAAIANPATTRVFPDLRYGADDGLVHCTANLIYDELNHG